MFTVSAVKKDYVLCSTTADGYGEASAELAGSAAEGHERRREGLGHEAQRDIADEETVASPAAAVGELRARLEERRRLVVHAGGGFQAELSSARTTCSKSPARFTTYQMPACAALLLSQVY